LTAQRLTIRSATTRPEDGIALPTWLVATEFGEPPDAASLRSFVRGALIDPTGSRAAAAKRVTAARRDNFSPPTVTVADGASEASTVLEIRAHDLPGMLLLAATEIAAAGVTVVRALVHTWGAEAVEVLYLQGADGTQLSVVDARRLAARVTAAVGRTRPTAAPG
ncbi:MAG: [protein-PII] uridylyltransferase, partial [Nakamurella sp.]